MFTARASWNRFLIPIPSNNKNQNISLAFKKNPQLAFEVLVTQQHHKYANVVLASCRSIHRLLVKMINNATFSLFPNFGRRRHREHAAITLCSSAHFYFAVEKANTAPSIGATLTRGQ